MVKKCKTVLVPPSVSSSDEELSDSEKEISDNDNDVVDSSDNDVSDGESEENDVDTENDVVKVEEVSADEQPIGLLKKSRAPAARPSTSKSPAAEPGSENESDGLIHSVSSPDSDGFTVRQRVAKPKKQVAAAGTSRRRPGKKSAARLRGTEVEKKRKRRKAEVGDGGERSGKKKKEVVVAGVGEGVGKLAKRAMFQRLWSEEDEIALLQGLGEYEQLNGTDPFYEMDGFFEFIKSSIKIKVTPTQLVNKARRMRRKFANNASRGKDGKDPSFRRPHDRRTFEISKTIWGDGKLKIRSNRRGRPFGTGKTATASSSREVIKKEKAPRQARRKKKQSGRDFWNRYPCVRDSVDIFPYLPDWGKRIMTEKLIHTPEDKMDELEGKWKQLRQAVGELHLSHIKLLKETLLLQDKMDEE